MITRTYRSVASFAVLAGLAILTSSCQKVPLLAPGGSIITLTSSVTALPINGSADVIAQVIEPAGTPPQRGTFVSFTTTIGSIQPSQAETDISGRAIVKFLAGTASGAATITAISGGVSVASANALKILVGTAAVGSVRVTASPTLLPATGGASTITAQALDINGNPLSSAPMTFATTAGTLDQGFVTTDQSGTATTTLRTSSQATVTAAVGAQAVAPPATGGGSGATPPPASTSGQASGTVTVNISSAPTLVITPPATLSAGLPATFIFEASVVAATGSAVRNVAVNWGDGRTQDLGTLTGKASVAHVYQSAGTFTVTATATDSFGNVVSNLITVTVNPKPQPVVSLIAPTTAPTAGTDAVFTASVAPAANTGAVIQRVSINFNDNTPPTELGAVTGTGIALHHVFPATGTFAVVLTATDSNGGVGTATTTVFVQAAPPLGVTISSTRTFVDSSNTLGSFTATVTGLGNDVVNSYLWNFGDGQVQTTTTNQVTHNYAHGPAPPPVLVRVDITTSSGRTAFNTHSFQQ